MNSDGNKILDAIKRMATDDNKGLRMTTTIVDVKDDPLVHCHIKFSFVSGAEPRTHDDTDFFALPFSVVRKDITGFSRKRKNLFFQFFSHAVFSVQRLGNCYFTDAQLICQILHGYWFSLCHVTNSPSICFLTCFYMLTSFRKIVNSLFVILYIKILIFQS